MRSKLFKISLVTMLISALLFGGVLPLFAGDDLLHYTVNPGDTLWDIARKYHVKVNLLAAMNGIDAGEIIRPGQVIAVPSDRVVIHRVKAGENLWAIARKYDVSLYRLINENDLPDRNLLRVGQELTIPVPLAKAVWLDDGVRSLLRKISWPVRGVISSFFGPRDGRMHEGLDIAADQGKNIKAAMDGLVIFAGPKGTYGNAVILNHGNGVRTLYAHASEILVEPGDMVPAGKPVAQVGSTGRSTGPHLHFEIQVNGEPLDPLGYLPGDN